MPDMTRGFGGISIDSNADPRVRRALGRLATPALLVTNLGVTINDQGKFALRLNGTTLLEGADGLSINPAGTPTVASLTTASLTVTSIVTMTSATITVTDAVPIAFGTTTGTKIGTATTQKLSFWNATPIVQPASSDQADITLGNADGEIASVGFTAANTFGTTNNEIGNLSFSAFYVDSEVIALRDKCEGLADDCIALRAVVASRKTECESLRAKCEELADDVRNLTTLVRAMRTASIATGLIKGSA